VDDLQPFTAVEIDYDFCSRTYGGAPCTAALGGRNTRKCFNTIRTCQDTDSFDRQTLTLRFFNGEGDSPKGGTWFPALKSVSTTSSTVNIAGNSPRLGAFGRRATITADLQDFTYHDRLTDKYQAERKSGAAQLNGFGYDPADFGTFFTNLKARWPYFVGRPMRVIYGYLKDGAVINETTRHYVIKNLVGPDDGGRVRIEGEDILALADKDRAQTPAPSQGVLAGNIGTNFAAFTLTPESIGDQYPASGRAVIGSEVIDYTRAGDVITPTARAIGGTQLSTHSQGDTFQQVLSLQGLRPDDALRLILTQDTQIDTAPIPTEKWEAETTRWLPSMRINADITKPTAVSDLVSELAVLGISVWWDDVSQEIGMKINRPTDGDVIHEFSDSNIISLRQEAREDERLTEVAFFSVQDDVTKSRTDEDNYNVVVLTVDADAKRDDRYGDTKIRKIFCRMLNGGAQSTISVLSLRLLSRFNNAPNRITLEVDARNGDVALTDVVRLRSRLVTDETGQPIETLFQVVQRREVEAGNKIELVCDEYDFDGNFAFFTQNDYPIYDTATDAQKQVGAFFSDGTNRFADGREPYVFI
jgi:hypothetical protein